MSIRQLGDANRCLDDCGCTGDANGHMITVAIKRTIGVNVCVYVLTAKDAMKLLIALKSWSKLHGS